MSKFNKSQTSFISGEIDPRVQGRIDIKEFAEACDEVQRFIPQPLGGVTKAPGTRFLAEAEAASYKGGRCVEFVFSNTEAYIVVFNTEISLGISPLKVFRTDGTEVDVDTNTFQSVSNTNYDPTNWQYAQSGDVIAFVYSLNTSEEPLDGSVTEMLFAPFFLWRESDALFKATVFSHPSYINYLPTRMRYSPAINRPYLTANADPNKLMYIDTVSEGTSRTLFAVDANGDPIPFFKQGHVFDSGFNPDTIGAFFKVSDGSTTGTCWGESWRSSLNIADTDIDTGTEIITSTGHGFQTRDRFLVQSANVSTETAMAGYSSLEAVGSFGYFAKTGQDVPFFFYINALSANTLALYANQADADADTNRIDFTATGDTRIVLVPYELNKLTVTVEETFPAAVTSSGAAVDDWHESAWSQQQGFPKAVAFFEGSLYMGGTRLRPDTFWKSQTGNIVNFMASRLDQDSSGVSTGLSTYNTVLTGDLKNTDPAPFDVASKQANVIQWLESNNTLQVGTMGAEYIANGGENILSNTSFLIKKQTEYGSTNIQAFSVGNNVMFVTRDGTRLRDYKYNRQNGSYVSANLNLLANHMVHKGNDGTSSSTYKGAQFVQAAYQPSREVVWLLTSNNELVSATISKDTAAIAWAYHPTRSGDTIKSICVAPSPDATYDRLYMVVERATNGGTLRFLEFAGDDFDHPVLNNTSSSDEDTAFYLDSAVKVTLGSLTDTVTLPSNVVTGGVASHLEGETVDVLAGNTIEKGLTVSSGQITLGSTYASGTVVVVGLRYTSRLKTVDIEAGGDFGSSQGARQRIDRVTANLYKSQAGSYRNQNQATGFDLEYDDSEVFTGQKRLEFEITPDMDNKVVIEHDDPVPFNLLSLTYRGVSYD